MKQINPLPAHRIAMIEAFELAMKGDTRKAKVKHKEAQALTNKFFQQTNTLAVMEKQIKTKINGKVTKVIVREFAGMYQILTGPYAMGIIRKTEVL